MADTEVLEPRDRVPEMLDRIVGGESLRSICLTEGMPKPSTFLRWVSEDEKLAEQYAHAMECRADAHHEEIFDIADDGSNDWIEKKNKDGSTYTELNHEHIQRSKLRIDVRKWSAGRMKPKRYGDRVTSVHEGGDKPIEIEDASSDRDAARRVAVLLAKGMRAEG